MVSIDELIEERRKMVMSDNGLDVQDNINGELSKEFMDLVRSEAQRLRTHGKTNYYLKIRTAFGDVFWRVKNGIRTAFVRTDRFLRKFSIYQNTIKPCLKKIYLFFLPKKKVRINRLFKLNDEEFIKELYRAFLNREADEEGYVHNLKRIQNKECDRLDMIYSFNDSFEGGRVPAKITGKFFLRMKKKSNIK